jgi:hypothetical protein
MTFFEIIYLIVTADKYIIMNYTLDDNILLTITTVVINSLCVGVDVYISILLHILLYLIFNHVVMLPSII